MENVTILQKFIFDNKLNFKDGYRNTPAAVISGFALSIGATEDEVIEAVGKVNTVTFNELLRVFRYASSKNYGDNWVERFGSNFIVPKQVA